MPITAEKVSALRGGYSAEVRIELRTRGGVFFPSHAAHDRVIFRDPQTIEPSLAQLIISVDGIEQQSNVEILEHESPSKRIPVRIV